MFPGFGGLRILNEKLEIKIGALVTLSDLRNPGIIRKPFPKIFKTKGQKVSYYNFKIIKEKRSTYESKVENS
jgi:hypothetical protein